MSDLNGVDYSTLCLILTLHQDKQDKTSYSLKKIQVDHEINETLSITFE